MLRRLLLITTLLFALSTVPGWGQGLGGCGTPYTGNCTIYVSNKVPLSGNLFRIDILSIDTVTNAQVTLYSNSSADPADPGDLVIGPDGNLYFADSRVVNGQSQIIRLAPTGANQSGSVVANITGSAQGLAFIDFDLFVSTLTAGVKKISDAVGSP